MLRGDIGPPQPRDARGQTGKVCRAKEIQLPDFATFQIEGKCDLCLWRYLEHLGREIERLAGGPIAEHYLRCVSEAYGEFIASGSQQSRFRTWVPIGTCCQWLYQLRRNARHELRTN